MMNMRLFVLFPVCFALLSGCSNDESEDIQAVPPPEGFINEKTEELKTLWIEAAAAAWAKATNITEETIEAEAAVNARVMAAEAEAIREAARYNDVETDSDTRRQLEILKIMSAAPAPGDPEKVAELADIMSRMEAIYGAGKVCEGEDCRDLQDLSEVMATSRDPDELLRAWEGWRTISPELRPLYARFVELTREGAEEIGFKDLSELWRTGYDMTPDEFSAELERLWSEVAPLYEELHCYTRAKLNQHYGDDVAPAEGLIPAHLLGNMWSQSWGNIYDLVAPYEAVTSPDPGAVLKSQNWDAIRMVKLGEDFFSSLGFDPLPRTFWERSLFEKPADRDVVCHASAWNMNFGDDVRIKMCVQPTYEDLVTIHHELGHNYYQRAYNGQPVLYQSGANDGFHEAIGDAIALSITPGYLKAVGLADDPDTAPEAVINNQMQMALEKIAFLPFGKLVDDWRWGVFSGETAPASYNTSWWDLRERYQGIAPPVERTEADFDPGAKYHVPANTPYTRYFLSFILQFQFHKALCEAAGFEGPLYECSIYGSKAAGERLNAMMELGQSKPWREALYAMAGTREMDAGALMEYFAPLRSWLKTENKGRHCGW